MTSHTMQQDGGYGTVQTECSDIIHVDSLAASATPKVTKSNRNCCVPKCKTWGYPVVNGQRVMYHYFPSDKETKRLWVLKTRVDIGKTFKLSDGKCVCSLHFKPEDYIRTGYSRPKLKTGSVPSVFNCWDDIPHLKPNSKARPKNRLQNVRQETVKKTSPIGDKLDNMPRYKKRLRVGMPRKKRTQKIPKYNEGAVKDENEAAWPDPVIKVEVADEDIDSLYQEDPFVVISSTDREARSEVSLPTDSALSLHSNSIFSSGRRNFAVSQINTEHGGISKSVVMDISRKPETVALYRNVAYQLEIERYIKLDHSYSLQDGSELSDVETESDNYLNGILNSYTDKETAEENELIFHDLDVADNVTVETDEFEKLYNDLKEIVEFPYILLKDEKIRILEHYEKIVKLCILIDSNLHMEIFVHNKQLPPTHEIFSFVSKEGVNVFGIKLLLGQLKEYQVCIGNSQPHCLERVSEDGFVYLRQSSKVIAYREDDFGARKNYFAEPYTETVRAVTCDLLLHIFRFKYKCPSCTRVGVNLKSRERTKERKRDNTEIRKNDIHPNDEPSKMLKSQLIHKLEQQRNEMSCQTLKIEKLERELSKLKQLKQVYRHHLSE